MILLETSAFLFGSLGLKRKFNQIVFYDIYLFITFLYMVVTFSIPLEVPF